MRVVKGVEKDFVFGGRVLGKAGRNRRVVVVVTKHTPPLDSVERSRPFFNYLKDLTAFEYTLLINVLCGIGQALILMGGYISERSMILGVGQSLANFITIENPASFAICIITIVVVHVHSQVIVQKCPPTRKNKPNQRPPQPTVPVRDD
jgi:hypothetical protein